MPARSKPRIVSPSPPDPTDTPTEALQIRYRPLRELIPYVRNARTHSDDQIALLRSSLAGFGWTTPMIVAGDDMLAGHARLTAALLMAQAGEPIPRNPDPWSGPVVDLSALSEPARRAYIIADNQLALRAGWDDAMLRLEVGQLQVDEFDLALLGFSDKDLDKLLVDAKAPEQFPGYDEGIDTEHQCPRCGYAWSGGAVTRSDQTESDTVED